MIAQDTLCNQVDGVFPEVPVQNVVIVGAGQSQDGDALWLGLANAMDTPDGIHQHWYAVWQLEEDHVTAIGGQVDAVTHDFHGRQEKVHTLGGIVEVCQDLGTDLVLVMCAL